MMDCETCLKIGARVNADIAGSPCNGIETYMKGLLKDNICKIFLITIHF